MSAHEKSMTETVTWTDAAQLLPEDSATVMIIIGGDVEATMGYHEDNQWHYWDGMPCTLRVIYWCNLLEGPK
ncbi:hypothetical protein [Dechloromonas denitrificans]|uniref:hypothetical protein n=1 Tax=Dechloromonas denitrificans TaxID=281362 RepID=UPI001CF8A1A7|nr:hypothetical protein [Dechloromonas denitrificans]UCV02340.1 hypothetical protein KI611_14740 [Dechloromonas denitrificans]